MMMMMMMMMTAIIAKYTGSLYLSLKPKSKTLVFKRRFKTELMQNVKWR